MDAPVNMEAIENAIHKWFQDATGLETIWMDQSAVEPPYPFGSLKITSGPTEYAPGWEERTRTLEDPEDQPLGQEVEISVSVPCQFTLNCQARILPPDARNPGWDAKSHIEKAKAALQLPSVQAAFRAVGLALVRSETVQNLSALLETSFLSRASMDVIFQTVLSAVELTGYIERVKAKSTSLKVDQTFGVLGD